MLSASAIVVLRSDGVLYTYTLQDVREQAAWALGNVAGDSVQCRDLVLSLGGLNALLQVADASVFKMAVCLCVCVSVCLCLVCPVGVAMSSQPVVACRSPLRLCL